MSERLQVLVESREGREIRRAAKAAGLSMSEWIRQALRDAYEIRPRKSRQKKLAVIRAAARNDFPAPDIEEMNAEIALGYASEQ